VGFNRIGIVVGDIYLVASQERCNGDVAQLRGSMLGRVGGGLVDLLGVSA
jgi:hypothetical protein